MRRQKKIEIVKILNHPFIWISIAIFAVFCVGYAKTDVKRAMFEIIDNNWETEVYEKNEELKSYYEKGEFSYPGQDEEIKNQIEIYNMQLKYDIYYDDWKLNLVYEYQSALANNDEEKAALCLGVIEGKKQWQEYYESLKEELLFENGENIGDDLEEITMRLDYDISPEKKENNWKNECLSNYFSNKTQISFQQTLDSMEREEQKICDYEKENREILYRLKNNIQSNDEVSLANYLLKIINFDWMFILVSIMLTIICVCQEYTYDTWKNVLTQNLNRRKVLLSKLAALMIISALLLVVYMLISIAVGSVFYGSEIHDAIIQVKDIDINMNYYIYCFLRYCLIYAECIVVSIITIVASIILKKSMAVMGVMTIIEFGIPQVAIKMYETNRITVFKYVPTLCYDLSQYLEKQTVVWGMTFSYGLAVYVLSIILGIVCMIKLFEIEDN